MEDSRGEPRIWVHLTQAVTKNGPIPDPCAETTDADLFEGVGALMDSVAARTTPVCLLAPASLRQSKSALPIAHRQGLRTVWYNSEVDLTLPRTGRKGWVCIVNGRHAAAQQAHSLGPPDARNYDVVILTPRRVDDPSFYGESVTVDGTGQVLRFRRHYDDSAKLAASADDEAVLIHVRAEHAHAVTAHLVGRGWSRSSLDALGHRYSLQWTHWPAADPVPGMRRPVERPPSSARSPRGGTDLLSDSSSASGSSTTVHPAIHLDDLERMLDDRAAPRGPGKTYEVIKRTMDMAAALAGLAVLFPFLAVISVLVKLTSPGPIFFSHCRQGRGGREFHCFKFRTMVPNAHEQQLQLREINEVDGPQFKIADDPRITRLGRWLRRFNVDEVPQLWNVLCGDMSLVGPRPSPDEENQLCPAWRRARLSVRPGLTGLWQVLRRREHPDLDFQEWIYYDMEYVRHRSLWLDLQLLLKTPRAMFAGSSLKTFVTVLQSRGICRHAGEMGWEPSAEAML